MEKWLLRLREMKKASRMTTKQIADGADIPEPTLEKIFSGQTKDPKYDTIRKLVHFLGYTTDDLDSPDIKKTPAQEESQDKGADRNTMKLFYRFLVDAGYVKEGVRLTKTQNLGAATAVQLLDILFAADAEAATGIPDIG